MRYNCILQNTEFINRLNDIKEYERDRIFCRHGIDHLLSVARAAYIISLEEGLALDKDVIYAAALLHDIGRGEEYRGEESHHSAGAKAAEKILINTCYTPKEIEEITRAVADHKQESGEPLSYVIYKADKLTRPCFMCPAQGECNWREEKKNKLLRY